MSCVNNQESEIQKSAIYNLNDYQVTISSTKGLCVNSDLSQEKNKSLKHLSILSFKPSALEQFAIAKKTYLESIEDIELLRALEIGLKIKSIKLAGDSFSVDVYDDYKKTRLKMSKDKFFKIYK